MKKLFLVAALAIMSIGAVQAKKVKGYCGGFETHVRHNASKMEIKAAQEAMNFACDHEMYNDI